VKGKTDTLRHENERLRAKLEEVKLISQAKCLLIEKKGCSEEAAHHLIERRAMNSRISAKEAAGQILRIYSDN
ncbi:MAG: ANTAR domain-containing protein, partial [Bullifex sp.]|nr:ANTAR domain-containing protein [Bullifex sp.]